ncbi:PEP-CTERM sorting domain-containing protein [Aquabacterium sp. J223]|uniref:PEP-CTERM sorting domain-containing protein n=1 Tax=Aquabacterium sp. J223 TaxID=2898431 RepID=UPI0021ADB9E1|nr:PEP-CTERM sorting domain-containing protein [Aquabacterium sp. J223]UUX97170.1 PEP-CTERM sorting domain-containing protein [Aquabacterium sp. J223]
MILAFVRRMALQGLAALTLQAGLLTSALAVPLLYQYAGTVTQVRSTYEGLVISLPSLPIEVGHAVWGTITFDPSDPPISPHGDSYVVYGPQAVKFTLNVAGLAYATSENLSYVFPYAHLLSILGNAAGPEMDGVPPIVANLLVDGSPAVSPSGITDSGLLALNRGTLNFAELVDPLTSTLRRVHEVNFRISSVAPVSPIPEPASLASLLAGLAALILRRRFKHCLRAAAWPAIPGLLLARQRQRGADHRFLQRAGHEPQCVFLFRLFGPVL